MLSAVGIITEYNPFHNGHLYQLNKAKELTNADLSIIVMSGNWVQRGQPAIVDKWSRTQMALNNGGNLIIELPSQFAVQPADLFAKAATQLINDLQCKWLAFGCEHPEFNFTNLAQKKLKKDPNLFNKYKYSYSYLYRQFIFNETGVKLDDPNDILAFNYAKANLNSQHPSKLVGIKRSNSQHNDSNINLDNNFTSSSSLRNKLFNKDYRNIDQFIPKDTKSLLNDRLINWEDFWPWLRYEIIESSIERLHDIYQMTEGLEYRLKRAAVSSNTFNEFINQVKTKRYTYSRIYRLCFYVLMHINASEASQLNSVPYIRVLGFDNLGRKYLNQIKSKVELPLISKINKNMLESKMNKEFKIGMLTEILLNRHEDLYRHPIIK